MAEEFALSVALCVKVSHVSHDKKILLYFFFLKCSCFFFQIQFLFANAVRTSTANHNKAATANI